MHQAYKCVILLCDGQNAEGRSEGSVLPDREYAGRLFYAATSWGGISKNVPLNLPSTNKVSKVHRSVLEKAKK